MSRRAFRHAGSCAALYLGLLATLVVAPPVPAEELPSVDAVLERFVNAVGGPAAFEAFKTRHYSGTIVQDLEWATPPHQETPFVAEAGVGGQVLYAESAEWTELPAADDGELQRKLRWILHPRFPLVVREFFPDLRVTGREVRAGRPVIVLTPAGMPAAHYALYFDEESGLLSHVGLNDDLKDWHDVGGTLFPASWVFGRKGGHTTYHFKVVETGPAPKARQ